MEIIPNSYIARVVLAYLYEEKLNQAAIELCKASPYLREERDFIRRGFRPATCISLKLTTLFREYGEIQQKVDHFVEKYGLELDIQPDLPLVRKVELLLTLLKQARHIKRRSLDDEVVVTKKESRKPITGCKRKRGAPSPHPSLSSSTPEVNEPSQKRVCPNPPAFIVLNDSGRNLSNLSHISPIGEGRRDDDDDSTQESGREEEGQDKADREDQEQEELIDVRKFPSIDLFSQTLLENDNYPEKIADLINKGLESSMSNQIDPKEGTSSATKEEIHQVKETTVVESESKTQQDCQSFNFNFDELISNIVNSAVKDPVFDDILDDISSKAVQKNQDDGTTTPTTTPPPETPLKDRLRKTCRKNYNPSMVKRSIKKVKVISDVPYFGGIPEGVDVEKSQPAAVTVVKVEPTAPVVSSNLNIPLETSIIQPVEVSSTADQSIPMSSSTTQFYMIQPDNTTKLVDINQLQFPTQQADSYGATQSTSTLIPISGTGIPEHTYFINVPNCYLDSSSQLPVYLNTYSPSVITEQSASNPTISILPEPSPDKFLIFPSSSTGSSTVSTVTNSTVATSIVSSSCTSTISSAVINSICSSFVPLIPKTETKSPSQSTVPLVSTAEVKSTPQTNIILNTKARSNSTPSRKASHIRILNFHTPAKQSPLAFGASERISTPGSAPPSVDSRPSRIPVLAERLMEPILETSIKQEPSKTPDKPASTPAALNSNSVSDTPRVAKDPRTCVRVLSRAASEEAVVAVAETPKPMVEIPSEAITEVQQKKTSAPRVTISEAEMEEWRRIRSVSKSNFDQHLRLMEEQRQQGAVRVPTIRKKRKKPPAKKATNRKVPEDDPASTPAKVDESMESLDRTDNSITDMHGQMLEDALASAKKAPEMEKPTPGKTPAKGKTPHKELPSDAKEQQGSKIYVKIGTPRKKTPIKASPKQRRPSKGEKSAKKRQTSSPRIKKEVAAKKTEAEKEVEETTKTEENKAPESVPPPEPEPIEEAVPSQPAPCSEPQPEPEQETPVKVEDSSLSQVEETPPEPPKPVKDHPKLLAKKSSAEYIRKEQEQSVAAVANTTSGSSEVTPPEKTTSVTVECTFGTSLFLETPFKPDLESIPITPRFLMPNQIENTPMTKHVRDGTEVNTSMKKSGDINTPIFPITPGLISTPISLSSVSPHSTGGGGTGGFSSRRTDYSSGSSYYKPDESEDLDKNIEAMLHGERRRRQAAESSDMSLEKPVAVEKEPEKPEVVESTPQKQEDHQEKESASSDSSSSSSSSSESSSSEESSPENTPIKLPKKASPVPSPEKPPTPQISAMEARRQQQAELEAKKQRTIARMKNAKPAPLKKTERKFVAPPGFKSRKVVITRKEPLAVSHAPTTTTSTRIVPRSASSKRKNPTPRKVILVERISPQMVPKKHSPKPRKSQSSPHSETNRRSSSRTLLPITEKDVPRILTPRKDQVIEGTYENENLSRLCCTPELPDVDPDKKSENAAETPDSNKENQSLEEPKPVVVCESSEDESDDAYDECSFGACYDDSVCKSFIRLTYNEKKSPVRQPTEIQPIKRMNIVLEDRKVCLEPQEAVVLFEQAPACSTGSSLPPKKSSSSRSTSKKSKSTKESKPVPVESPVNVTTVSTSAPAIKAKINVVSAVRGLSNAANKWRTAARLQAAKLERRQAESLAANSKKDARSGSLAEPEKPIPTKAPSPPEEAISTTVGKELPISPSPKMPLKLDMKKKLQQPTEERKHVATLATEPPVGNSEATADGTAKEGKEDGEKEAPSPPEKAVGDEFAIDLILTHIHG